MRPELAEEFRDRGHCLRRYDTRESKEYCFDDCRLKAYYYEVVKPRKQKRAVRS
jgi:hypothetical protein